MVITRWTKVVTIFLLCGAGHFASATPMIPLGAESTGGTFNTASNRVEAINFNYDNSTGHMTYSANGGGLSLPDVPPPFGRDADGLFAWTANINRDGTLNGIGAMSFALDIGNGIELLATGKVVDFGFGAEPTCFGQPLPAVCDIRHPQVAIEITYIDARIASLGNLWLWKGFVSSNHGHGPLDLHSFDCNRATRNNCGRFSGDQTYGYNVAVSEPHALMLMTFGLFALGAWRRAKLHV
jgi:hypothetical protein